MKIKTGNAKCVTLIKTASNVHHKASMNAKNATSQNFGYKNQTQTAYAHANLVTHNSTTPV